MIAYLRPSTNDAKKYTVTLLWESGRRKTIHFGQKGDSDFTKHKDMARRKRYEDRHRTREDWKVALTQQVSGPNGYYGLSRPCTQVPCTQVPCTQVPCTQVPCTQVPCTQVPCKKQLPPIRRPSARKCLARKCLAECDPLRSPLLVRRNSVSYRNSTALNNN